MFKSSVEPIKGDMVIARGTCTLTAKDDLRKKFTSVLKRAPGLDSIRVTNDEGVVTAVYTRGEVERIIAGIPSVKAATTKVDLAAAATEMSDEYQQHLVDTAQAPAPKAKRTKAPKPTNTGKGKPGVINAIAALLVGATGDGLTIAEILTKLQEQFPERVAEAMAITVRCQLGRLEAQRGLTIVKTKVDKVTKYRATEKVAA